MLEIARTFGARHPGCEVALIDIGLVRNQLDQRRSGDLDLLVMRLPISEPDSQIGPTLTSEQASAAGRRHSPPRDRESISYEELAPYRISDAPGLPREMIDAFVPPRTPSGALLQRANSRTIVEAMMRVAVGNRAHATVPSVLEHLPTAGITAVRIHDRPPSHTALVWLKRNRAQGSKAFVQVAADMLGACDQPVPGPDRGRSAASSVTV